MHWDYDGGWGWGAWLAMTLTMVVFWGGLATVIVLMLRRTATTASPRENTSAVILAERFARGEIDEAEYERRRKVLRQ
jgi:putative membrane protein